MIENIADIFKEFRQYLCNTEFAPPPFDDKPVDAKVINEVFPRRILSLLTEEIKKSLLTEEEIVRLWDGRYVPPAPQRVAQAQLDKVLKIVEGK